MIYLKWSGVTAALTAAAPDAVAKNMDWSILWHVGSVVELHVSMQAQSITDEEETNDEES